jgi:hypothetical protein
MKKVILPVLAFFFAIVASVATVNANDETLLDKRVSLPAPSACSQILTHHCEFDPNGPACTNSTGQSLREYKSDGTCGLLVTGIYEAD